MQTKNLKQIFAAIFTTALLIACGDKNSPLDLPSPEITSVDPDSAAPGEIVTVKGNNFGNDSTQIKITMDGQVGAIVSASAGKVSFKVPTLAPNSYELLAELSGRKSASKTFVVKPVVQTNPAPLPVTPTAPKPSISSIAPQSGFVDSDATIQGLNFGTDQSKISLEIGGQIVTVKAFSATSLTFTIPSSLSQGSYSVKLNVDGQGVTTQFRVTVPVPPAVGVSVATVGNVTQTTPGGKITLNATVTGSNSLVNWSVSGSAGALSSTSGLNTVFTANAVTDVTTLQVTATLAADSSKSYPVELTVNPIVQPVATVAGSVDGILAVKTNGDLFAWGANNAGQVGDGTTAHRSAPTFVLSDVSSVAGGGAFSMALKTDGNVWAWGNNDFGQLGDGTKTSRSTPAIVSGLNNVKAITAGQVFSSTLKFDGTVWTWGTNADGRLGRNLATDVYPIPAQVPGLTGVIALASGYSHTLAVKTDGSVWAWGYNGNGQLGESTSNLIRNAPVQIQGLPAIASVAAGAEHSLAIARDGKLWVWGKNDSGQLGDGSTTNASTPKLISSMTGIRAIASRTNTSLAVKTDGSLWTFGANPLAQIGNGLSINALQPTKVLEGVALPVGGGLFSAALKTDGTLAVWGNNSWGELGDGAAVWRNTPVKTLTSTGAKFTAVAAGSQFGLALDTTGAVWGWGFNSYGQVGDGSTGSFGVWNETPKKVISSGVKSISSFNEFALALKTDGTVWAWGNNLNGQLGQGDRSNRVTPVQVKNLMGVQAISAGYEYALALKTNGELWGWGGNYFGHAAGRPSNNTDLVDPNEAVTADRKSILNPVLVTSNILNFAAGEASTFVYRSDGTSFSWGYNDASDGRLGTGNGNGSSTPVVVSGLSNVKAFATGLGHAYALKNDGIIWAWGNRGNCSAYPNCTLPQGTGYFADGSPSNTTAFSPIQISTISGVNSIASGWYHTLAIKSDGTVWAWGLNGERGGSYDGRSGSGNLSPFIYSPEQVIIPGGASISQVDGGTNFSLAVSSSGDVYAWGADYFGQLGTGRSLTRPTAPTSSNLTGFKLPN